MNKIGILIITLAFALTSVYADIDCPADSSFHVDMRTMLPDVVLTLPTGSKFLQDCVHVLHLKMVLR